MNIQKDNLCVVKTWSSVEKKVDEKPRLVDLDRFGASLRGAIGEI